jgi:hypothetical protein
MMQLSPQHHPRVHQHRASPQQQQALSAQHHRQRFDHTARATNQPPPPSPDSNSSEVTIAQGLTAIGLNGTLAVAGASLCGVDLFAQFHFGRTADISLALQFQSVLLLLEAALFLPPYAIPQSLLEPQQEQQQQQPQQQRRNLDVAAVGRLGAWSLEAWQLMLSMLRSVIRRPQLQQLPLPVRCFSSGLTQQQCLTHTSHHSHTHITSLSHTYTSHAGVTRPHGGA